MISLILNIILFITPLPTIQALVSSSLYCSCPCTRAVGLFIYTLPVKSPPANLNYLSKVGSALDLTLKDTSPDPTVNGAWLPHKNNADGTMVALCGVDICPDNAIFSSTGLRADVEVKCTRPSAR